MNIKKWREEVIKLLQQTDWNKVSIDSINKILLILDKEKALK